MTNALDRRAAARLLRQAILLGVLGIFGAAHAATLTRTSAFEYDSATGLLTKEIIEPDSTQLRLETTYTYDAYGNKVTATVSSPATGTAAITSRSSGTAFDTRGQFPVSSTNALSQSETKLIEVKFGNLTSLTGPNGLTTTWTYDSLGRKTLETRADGNKTKFEYLYCAGYNGGSASCVSLARYLVVTTPLAADGTTQNGPWGKTYYDALGREIRAETQGFDGSSVIIKDTEYDSLGRVYRVSNPYYSGQTVYWTTMAYDALGRVATTTMPDSTQTTNAYNGLTTSATNALSQTQTKIKNSQGQLAQVIDAANNTISYQYDPFGNLTKTTDPVGNITTLAYDLRGRKTQMTDPNMGTWSYEYNALGELVRQTDAKSQVTTMAYDLLGRMTTRSEADLISTWTFDSCTKGIGKQCGATTDNGYSRSQAYDSLGRPNSTTTVMDATYVTGATFDAHGRVATQTYPTGFAVKYVYTSLGYLKEVRNNATNALFWQADTKDASGHLLQQTFGNGVVTQQVYQASTGRLLNIYAGAGNGVQNLSYTYDSLANMLSRSDANQSLSETFLYDSLNRLTSATVNSSGAGIVTQTFGYNAIGNITSRSDVGTYTYGATNNRPHAVAEVQLAAGGKRVYTYDANGALTNEVQYDASNNVITSKGRTEVYTSFNMPQAIGAPGISLGFVYGPEHQRVKQIAPAATTIYLHPDNEGGLSYEKDIKPDTSVEHKHFITAGSQVVALVKQTVSATTVRYFHRDHLGSTTTITDESGSVLERMAYEPFGKRRFANGSLDPNGTIVGVNTDRGFTNHEHLDELGLIHMNGRIYDPVIGRFMSGDSILQAPDNLQSYNRYAYVLNNPINAVDPSGHVWWWIPAIILGAETAKQVGLIDKATARAIQGIGVGMLVGQPIGGFGGALAGGFAGGLVSSGNLQGGLQGMFSAGLFYGAGQLADGLGVGFGQKTLGRALIHAGAGCIGAAAAGGDCVSGALSAGITKYVGANHLPKFDSHVANAMAWAVLGGSAAVVSGGKFQNGATTGAFQYLYNQAVTEKDQPANSKKNRGRGTIFVTGGGSAVAVAGVEGSAGVYLSTAPFDIGVVVSGGAGGGGNIGLSAQVGVVPGPLSNVSGTTVNYNASAAIGSGTVMTDPNTGEITGATAGLGSRLGGSVTASKTSTYGLRDAAQWAMENGLGKAIDWATGQ
jgi:RHS repeat-associated protein